MKQLNVENIVVVGAGIMGRGIAYVSALAGFQTTLVDINEQQLQLATTFAKQTAKKGVARNKITEEEADLLLENFQTTLHLEQAVKKAHFCIEAVPEKLSLKQEVLEKMCQHASDYVTIVSNTSTMSPTELASFTERPNQVAAMHFFNPVHIMPLIEIVKGLETSDETIETIERVAQKMGKETVLVNEFPGFVTSRISALVGNEAFHMLQEGVASAEDIDKAIRLGLNYPMGPFELVDLVGLDVRLNNLNYLHETLGEQFRPAPLLEQYVKAGRLGRKVGKGIYHYTEQGERITK